MRSENTNSATYVVATTKPWNIKVFNEIIKHYPGKWHLIKEPSALTADEIKLIAPHYVFFPHWSETVPTEILTSTNCVGFHEADLPYGRGGSPIQNLIACGHRETFVTAFKMSEELDAGPIYLKKPLSLEGSAEEIFIRSSRTVAEMIRAIVTDNPTPEEQTGEPTFFARRKPSESRISEKDSLLALYDHIRMLDAESYPRAFIEIAGFRYEISRASLKTNEILADVRITRIDKNNDD